MQVVEGEGGSHRPDGDALLQKNHSQTDKLYVNLCLRRNPRKGDYYICSEGSSYLEINVLVSSPILIVSDSDPPEDRCWLESSRGSLERAVRYRYYSISATLEKLGGRVAPL